MIQIKSVIIDNIHYIIISSYLIFVLCLKLFKQLYITIQFSVSTVSMSKIVQFKTIQFSKSTQFKCKYSLIVKKHFYFELFSLVKQFYFS